MNPVCPAWDTQTWTFDSSLIPGHYTVSSGSHPSTKPWMPPLAIPTASSLWDHYCQFFRLSTHLLPSCSLFQPTLHLPPPSATSAALFMSRSPRPQPTESHGKPSASKTQVAVFLRPPTKTGKVPTKPGLRSQAQNPGRRGLSQLLESGSGTGAGGI